MLSPKYQDHMFPTGWCFFWLIAGWGKFRNKNRPKLKKVGPEVHPDQDTTLREEHDVDEDDAWV